MGATAQRRTRKIEEKGGCLLVRTTKPHTTAQLAIAHISHHSRLYARQPLSIKQRCRTHYVPDIIVVVDDVVDHLAHTLSSFAISLYVELSFSLALFISLCRVWPFEHPWMDGCDAIRHSGEWVSSDSTIFSIQESSWRSTEMRCPAMLAPHTTLCAAQRRTHNLYIEEISAIVIGMPFDPSFSACMREYIMFAMRARIHTAHTYSVLGARVQIGLQRKTPLLMLCFFAVAAVEYTAKFKDKWFMSDRRYSVVATHAAHAYISRTSDRRRETCRLHWTRGPICFSSDTRKCC